jgi:hypothetical protein
MAIFYFLGLVLTLVYLVLLEAWAGAIPVAIEVMRYFNCDRPFWELFLLFQNSFWTV